MARTKSVGRRKSKNKSTAAAEKKKENKKKTEVGGTKERHHYEFGGPIGSWMVMWGLPLAAFWLIFSIQRPETIDRMQGKLDTTSWTASTDAQPAYLWGLFLPQSLETIIDFAGASVFPIPSAKVMKAYLAWFAFQFALHAMLPARLQKGVELPNGEGRLVYRLNGWKAFMVSLAGFVVVLKQEALGLELGFDEKFIAENFMQFFFASNIFSWAFAGLLYAGCMLNVCAGLKHDRVSGCTAYDYFFGQTTNPRVGWWDIKFFCESRPGLILWVLVNYSCAAAAWKENDVNWSMVTVCAFQTWYIIDYFWQEESI